MSKEDLKARTSFLLVLAPPPALRNRNGSAREPFHLEAKTYFKISLHYHPNKYFTSSTTCCERVRCLLLEFAKIKTDEKKTWRDEKGEY